MRDIIGYIFFFTIGLVSAGAYFYQLHPEHSMDSDLPRIKRDVHDAIDRGNRIREAWEAEKPETSNTPKETTQTQSETVQSRK